MPSTTATAISRVGSVMSTIGGSPSDDPDARVLSPPRTTMPTSATPLRTSAMTSSLLPSRSSRISICGCVLTPSRKRSDALLRSASSTASLMARLPPVAPAKMSAKMENTAAGRTKLKTSAAGSRISPRTIALRTAALIADRAARSGEQEECPDRGGAYVRP